ncbi:MAG: 1-deoxy-D-xylulose-5-phosphate reductoisomerase [Ruminococcaceae bacterium]|nr:1-deoxy-D-xylulose-5-phosphate reductoisomerase [Oscillospiraceae bacterium]
MKKTIAILGATGSVGMQADDVAQNRGYAVDFISANRDVSGMEELVRKFSPSFAAMADSDAAADLKTRIADTKTRVLVGEEGICEGVAISRSETVINSIIGKAGLAPTLAVIDSGKRLALANKESLVVAGDIVMSRAREKGVQILPVDSEHSAIFQSLFAGKRSEIKKIILTASGGPFFGKRRHELESVTVADTLAHPTWKMGQRITVDSATLMNKGFEVIEAAHLFSVSSRNIEVVIHRESILHSAVEYIDNTVVGEFSVPDMRMCVQYAIDYPERYESVSEELDLIKLGNMSFFKPDYEAFPLLALASRAMELGGAMPAVLNAADEIAVEAFLAGRITFLGIADVVGAVFDKLSYMSKNRTLDEIICADTEARALAKELIKEK